MSAPVTTDLADLRRARTALTEALDLLPDPERPRHAREADGALCGRGGRRPQLADDDAAVTCRACRAMPDFDAWVQRRERHKADQALGRMLRELRDITGDPGAQARRREIGSRTVWTAFADLGAGPEPLTTQDGQSVSRATELQALSAALRHLDPGGDDE